jgi:triosephosphate isomerase
MSRRLFIAGNWKMNLDRAGAAALATSLVRQIGSATAVDLAAAPPFVYLSAVGEALRGSRIALAAQDMFYEDNGAFTGEVSGAMLRDVGCSHVILGHSERRHVIGETDEVVSRKVVKALGDGLKVILCVGELLGQREAGETADVVTTQVKVGIEGVSAGAMSDVTIAYEPVWAIGTGKTATPAQAQEAQAYVRKEIGKLYSPAVAQGLRIQYGGSVKVSNAQELMAQADVDGALVGGASLKADEFLGIIKGAIAAQAGSK